MNSAFTLVESAEREQQRCRISYRSQTKCAENVCPWNFIEKECGYQFKLSGCLFLFVFAFLGFYSLISCFRATFFFIDFFFTSGKIWSIGFLRDILESVIIINLGESILLYGQLTYDMKIMIFKPFPKIVGKF